MGTVKVTDSDHKQGAANPPIVLVEYGDYQCPYCGEGYYIVKNLQKKLGDQLQFIFRNYPLTDLHAHALHAALAAETAALEGKFWEMHDKIFENQTRLDDRSLLVYAEAVGLEAKKFQNDFENPAVAAKVQQDVDSGNAAGVDGTPYFFVNGELFEGNWQNTDFLEYLESLV